MDKIKSKIIILLFAFFLSITFADILHANPVQKKIPIKKSIKKITHKKKTKQHKSSTVAGRKKNVLTSHHKKSLKQKTHRLKQTAKKNLPVNKKTPINTSHLSLSHIETSAAAPSVFSNIEKNLVNFIRGTISSLNYTHYRLGGNRFDTSRGIYVVDCSAYIDNILKTVYPNAYTSLKNWSGTDRPTTNNYYEYFSNLSDQSTHWNSVEKVESLRPGDVIVFRYSSRRSNDVGGHVMIVMEQPKREGDTFLVRIADSAPSAHSKDTRLPRTSGIGIGTMLLKMDTVTHEPYAYAWSIGSRFKKNVNIAMARPVERK